MKVGTSPTKPARLTPLSAQTRSAVTSKLSWLASLLPHRGERVGYPLVVAERSGKFDQPVLGAARALVQVESVELSLQRALPAREGNLQAFEQRLRTRFGQGEGQMQ